MINVIAGLERPSSGLVLVDGIPVLDDAYQFLPNLPPSEVKSVEILDGITKNFMLLYRRVYPFKDTRSTPIQGCILAIYTYSGNGLYTATKSKGILKTSIPVFASTKEFYIPNEKDLAVQSYSNKQGRGAILSKNQSIEALRMLKADAEKSYQTYEYLLNETNDGKVIDENKDGLARELARINLTLNTYTQWYWKTDLYNLLRFLGLRADSYAQYEIRVYAEAMIDTLKLWVPLAHAAFMEYEHGGVRLSATALESVKRMIAGEKIGQAESGLSKREWRELMAMLERDA